MGVAALWVAFAVTAMAAVAGGRRPSYAEDPNNYNCGEDEVEFKNPVPYSSDQMRSRYYGYYSSPQEHLPSRNVPARNYPTFRTPSGFYQAFRPVVDRSLRPSSKNSDFPLGRVLQSDFCYLTGGRL